MAYAISPYAWGYITHPKLRAQAQANAMKAAERALVEVEKAIVVHLCRVSEDATTLTAAGAAHEIADLIARRTP
jgi:hypothetical protein